MDVEGPAIGSPSHHRLVRTDSAYGLRRTAIHRVDRPALARAGAQEQLVIRREKENGRIRNSFGTDRPQRAFLVIEREALIFFPRVKADHHVLIRAQPSVY